MAKEKAAQIGEKNWYIVTAYANGEDRVAENIRRRIVTMGMQNYIFRVIVCNQEVPELKDGLPTGKTKIKNLYPGYVFVEMVMNDTSWYIVRNTPGVTGIVGSSGGGQKPTPVPDEEMEAVLKRMGIVDSSMYDKYAIGDMVRIIHGPMEGTEGKITDINKETGLVKVDTIFFGRVTPLEVDFSEIDKL